MVNFSPAEFLMLPVVVVTPIRYRHEKKRMSRFFGGLYRGENFPLVQFQNTDIKGKTCKMYVFGSTLPMTEETGFQFT